MSYVRSSPPVELDIEYVQRELVNIEISSDQNSRNIGQPFKAATASFTAGDDPYIFVDATSGAVTVTLPETVVDTMLINVKKTDSSSNAVTVSGGTKNIDGATTAVLTCQYESLTLYWDKTQWWII